MRICKQNVSIDESLFSAEYMDKDKSYLVLNESNGTSSISLTSGESNKEFNGFWDAYRFTKREERTFLDYYTQLKIQRFEQQNSLAIQGLNIFDGDKESVDKKSGESFVISPHKVERIKSELWLKNQVFLQKTFADIDLPNGQFKLIYVRRLGGKWNNFFSSVVDINIESNVLTIESNKLYKSENRMKADCSFFSDRKLFNGSFYLYDKENDVLLSSYTSIGVPQIIGNTEVDSISVAESNELNINRKSGMDVSILPYYLLPIERKQYHHVYLQDREPDLLYFVAPKQRPNQDIAKQNRIYNILTFDGEGTLLKAIEQPITHLFLSSFTEDILRINEVSKSSLFEKIAKLYIEN